MWRIWCYALGKKEGRDKKDADKIAFVRTIIMIQLIVTNSFIIAGNIRHWNDGQCANQQTVQIP
tara:strand:- start:93 stop:284 length:192 start_codon:yes stop_codon:yes gene_type:complete